jgi:hypothetical protein
MAKEVVNIRLFNSGIIGGLDERDIPLDAFAYSEGLNPVAIQGKLSGIETDREVVSDVTYDAAVTGASGGAGGVTAAANYEDGDDVVLVDSTSDSIVEITDIDGTPSVSELESGVTIAEFTSEFTDEFGNIALSTFSPQAAVYDGAAVHIGLGANLSADPKWVGEISFGQFGGAVATGTQIQSDQLKRVTDDILTGITANNEQTASAANETVFAEDSIYWYAYTLQYDGYQEGPLSQGETASALNQNLVVLVDGTTYGYKSWDVNLTIDDTAADWSSRISGINLYRGTGTASYESTWPDTEMEYLTTIAIDNPEWGGSSGARTYTFTDDVVALGDTYSTRTGIPATQKDMDFHWGLSCATAQYHFIANVVTELDGEVFDEAERAIYRSRPYQFSMFSKLDFVLLPVKPIALAAFRQKVYAFAANRAFIIDATTLDILEEIDGVGCFGQSSVIVTDHGMFFCDRNNIYITDFDGRITPIGMPVLKNDVDTKAAYLSRSTATDPVVFYDAKYNAYGVAYVNSGSTVSFLMYRPQQAQTIDLPRGRWDHILTTYTSLGIRIPSIDDHPLLVLDGDIVEIFGGASTRAWTATLREIETPEYSKYYECRVLGDNVTVEYSEDGGAFASATMAAEGTGVFKGEVNSRTGRSWSRVRTHQLRLTGTAGQEVDSIAVTRRRMVQT